MMTALIRRWDVERVYESGSTAERLRSYGGICGKLTKVVTPSYRTRDAVANAVETGVGMAFSLASTVPTEFR